MPYPRNPVALDDLPGPGGSSILKLPNGTLPANVTALRFTFFGFDWQIGPLNLATNFDIAASAFTNGEYTIPPALVAFISQCQSGFFQAVFADGSVGNYSFPGSGWAPFYDGRSQIQQNISFILRAAGQTNAFTFLNNDTPVDQPSSYAYAGLYDYYDNNNLIDTGRPFVDNFLYRNFAFSTTNLGSTGYLDTGIDGADQSSWSLADPLTFAFEGPTNAWVGSDIPTQLSYSQTEWMMPYANYADLGIQISGSNYFLPSNIKNYCGLPLTSVKLAYLTNGTPAPYSLHYAELDAGSYLLIPTNVSTCYFYPNFAEPGLQILSYSFLASYNISLSEGGIFDPFPGNTNFSPADPQPLLIASVGRKSQFAAFAKETITNGYSFYPVYVGQYFDQAFRVTNGITTSNIRWRRQETLSNL